MSKSKKSSVSINESLCKKLKQSSYFIDSTEISNNKNRESRSRDTQNWSVDGSLLNKHTFLNAPCNQSHKNSLQNQHLRDCSLVDYSDFGKRKTFDFFNTDGITLANALLGQLVVRKENGQRLSGIITETEVYAGISDPACHSFKGKRTTRTEPMFMTPGTAYVYVIYGVYHCFNICSKDEGGCVLIRGLKPVEGLEYMQKQRLKNKKSNQTEIKDKNLCNGPSKLCQALCITKEKCNKLDLSTSDDFWIETQPPVPSDKIVITKRVGINPQTYGKESAEKPHRFYRLGCECVSVRDRAAEKEVLERVEK